MASSAQDIPGVVVFPPLVPLTTVGSSALMQIFFPLHLFAHSTWYVRLPLGVTLAVAGIADTFNVG